MPACCEKDCTCLNNPAPEGIIPLFREVCLDQGAQLRRHLRAYPKPHLEALDGLIQQHAKSVGTGQPTRARGEYLARYVSDCVNCHTQLDSTTFVPQDVTAVVDEWLNLRLQIPQ